MNDFAILVLALGVAAICLVAFGAYVCFGGRQASLVDAEVGQVYNFEYLQPLHGENERHLAKVIEKTVLTDRAIEALNRRSGYRKNDKDFKRTRNLVTCETANGEVRNFYAERVVNCRKPLLARLVMH
tara:strand:- start:132 stop:515 length:384 start_codon:yes stop_codon:yes gene_type:complete